MQTDSWAKIGNLNIEHAVVNYIEQWILRAGELEQVNRHYLCWI